MSCNLLISQNSYAPNNEYIRTFSIVNFSIASDAARVLVPDLDSHKRAVAHTNVDRLLLHLICLTKRVSPCSMLVVRALFTMSADLTCASTYCQ